MSTAKARFDARKELENVAWSLLQPPPELQVYEWAEKNIYLTERESPGASGHEANALRTRAVAVLCG